MLHLVVKIPYPSYLAQHTYMGYSPAARQINYYHCPNLALELKTEFAPQMLLPLLLTAIF